MSMTLKQIVQAACRRTGLPVPAGVVGTSVPQVVTLLGLMEELLDDLTTRKTWQQVQREAAFTAVAGEDQGKITTIADTGFVAILPGTFFNRDTGLEVTMGLRADGWQAMKAGPGVAGPFYEGRLRNDNLLISPEPVGGENFAFEYQSKAYILDEDGTTYKERWERDTDVFILPESIGIAWLKAAYKREKGLEYAEDAIRYETLLDTYGKKDNTPRNINMAGCSGTPKAGVIVPVGDWNL